jgi:hypothetical protein
LSIDERNIRDSIVMAKKIQSKVAGEKTGYKKIKGLI